ncbi:MAG TPA: sigma-70 family RNA polymerase sigma factor [Kiritimatiellia bacterium]|nr:sigma-70 family RNA polymerase sigma factor [Kiritimatiellia bacterium]
MTMDQETARWIDRLVAEYEQPLCRYAFSMLRSSSAAQDAVQETFLRLCREKPARLGGHEAAWLFRVCRSRVLDLLRKEKPVQPLMPEQVDRVAAADPDPAQHAVRGESEVLAARLLDRMPQPQQEVIRLKFQQDLSYREIARITRLSEGNVGYLIHTGLKELRRQMQSLQGAVS